MKNKNARKGMQIIIALTVIIFLVLTIYQITIEYIKLKEESNEENAYIKDDISSKSNEVIQPIDTTSKMTISECLIRDGVKISLKSAQISLFIMLILTMIWFIVCKIRKEILIKESLSIMGLELGFFIVISYILFVAGFPIE
ncbi:MAG: hypothetical protein ACLR4X_01845 [Clostridia bacterium]